MRLKYKCLVLDHDDTVVDSTAKIHFPAFLVALRVMRPGVTMELEEYFIFWYDRRDLLDALDKSGLVGHLIERTVNFPIADRIVISRFLPNDNALAREIIFRFAFSGLVYTMISWYRSGFKVSTREMAETTCRLLRDPLFPQLKELGIE